MLAVMLRCHWKMLERFRLASLENMVNVVLLVIMVNERADEAEYLGLAGSGTCRSEMGTVSKHRITGKKHFKVYSCMLFIYLLLCLLYP